MADVRAILHDIRNALTVLALHDDADVRDSCDVIVALLRELPVEGQAKVDPPGASAGGAVVDGGGALGDASPAPGLRVTRSVAPPIVIEDEPSPLRDLVEEARDLAKHLLDQGECPECHGGECETCKGFGYVDGADLGPDGVDDAKVCPDCSGEGGAPHIEGCRLSTFPARAAKELA